MPIRLPLKSSLTWSDDDEPLFDDGGMSDYKPVLRSGGDREGAGQQKYVGGFGDTEVVTLDGEGRPKWRWCLLTMDGNATIIQVI